MKKGNQKSNIRVLIILIVVCFSFLTWGIVLAYPGKVYMPVTMANPPTETPEDTATLTLEPTLPGQPTRTLQPSTTPSGINMACTRTQTSSLCVWLSNPNPVKNSTVEVAGQYLVNGAGQANLTMTTTWHYKSTTSSCTGITDSGGLSSCSRSIGAASSGYTVTIDVTIGSLTATTWFTPQ